MITVDAWSSLCSFVSTISNSLSTCSKVLGFGAGLGLGVALGDCTGLGFACGADGVAVCGVCFFTESTFAISALDISV